MNHYEPERGRMASCFAGSDSRFIGERLGRPPILFLGMKRDRECIMTFIFLLWLLALNT